MHRQQSETRQGLSTETRFSGTVPEGLTAAGLVARAVHDAGSRRGRPWVTVNTQLDADEIESGLARHDGDIAAAAFELEVSAQGLKLRMKTLGLRPPPF